MAGKRRHVRARIFFVAAGGAGNQVKFMRATRTFSAGKSGKSFREKDLGDGMKVNGDESEWRSLIYATRWLCASACGSSSYRLAFPELWQGVMFSLFSLYYDQKAVAAAAARQGQGGIKVWYLFGPRLAQRCFSISASDMHRSMPSMIADSPHQESAPAGALIFTPHPSSFA